MDPSLYEINGARSERPSRFNSICTLKFIGGTQTQRSPFMSVDSRYNSKYLGGRPDALIYGGNVELSNRLTLQRRPGLLPYGPSVPPVDFFYSYQQATLANFVNIVDPNFVTYPSANLQLILDTATNGTSAPGNIYNYSPTFAGTILNKAPLSQQASLLTSVNTAYIGDGVDLYKLTGNNLLTYSNNFGGSGGVNAPWTESGTVFAAQQSPDPVGGSNATEFAFLGTISGVFQNVIPNYVPVGSNTFTFSIWLKANTGNNSIQLILEDQSSNVIANQSFSITSNWALYQITGTSLNTATSLKVQISTTVNTAGTFFAYGAQLEVGGPATPTVITQNQPLGLSLWGIQAPPNAPTFTSTKQNGSTGQPWQPNHAYSQTNASVTAIAASVGGTAVYTTTIPGGAANGLVGRYFSILGDLVNPANNSTAPGFIATASTSSTITLNNPAAVAEGSPSGVTATLLDTIVDSNGNLEVAYTPGVSGGSQPTWSVVQGGSTFDGLQNVVVQSVTSTAGTVGTGTTASVTFPTAVTATNQLLVAVYVSHPQSLSITDTAGDSFGSSLKTVSSGQFTMYLYYVQSAVGGTTTINVTGGGNTGTYIAAAELTDFTGKDVNANALKSNTTNGSGAGFFNTGGVTTTNATDFIVSVGSFAVSASQGAGAEIGVPPTNYNTITSDSGVSFASNTAIFNLTTAFTSVSAAGFYNPNWTITSPTVKSAVVGITGSFTTTVGTLVWYNVGQTPITGLSPKTGYQYYYSFVNIYTGHRSNVSPISASTGALTGVGINVTGQGMQIEPSGPYSADPQVTAIEVYRNTDGGGFWYQIPPALMTNTSGIITVNGVQYLANPGTATAAGAWFFTDLVPDINLNTQIFAPIAFLNTPPPAGLTNLEFFDGRFWGSVGNILYYATAPDDASLVNVLENGVSAESWEPTNFITFNSQIVRIIASGVGLLVFTTTDNWVVSGNNLANYSPVKVLTGVGLGTYNGIVIDGSTMMLYTRDRQALMFNVSAGATEIGFLIGDLIEDDINPMTCYLCRHIKGSQDNAFYLGDGATGWLRLNPNQYGASASGEQTPIWSPFATIASVGGCGAIASIETTPGVKTMLVSQATGVGPILNRDINTFSDNGTPYTWNATIGSLMLALPGKLAETESITTQMTAATANQCSVAVLLDEIAPSAAVPFETLTYSVSDPPQLAASVSILSNRFYLSPGSVPPICQNMQILLSGAATATRDEILSLTVRGAIVEEQA